MFGQAAGCLGSAVLADAAALVPMPPAVSFAEAATIPTVFLTAYNCLREAADAKRGSRVLIHAATGEQRPMERALSPLIVQLADSVRELL